MVWFKKNNNDYSAVLDADDDGLVVFDEYGKIKFVNRAAADLAGYSNSKAMIDDDVLKTIVLRARDGAVAEPINAAIVTAAKNRQRFESRNYEIVSAKGGTSVAVYVKIIPFEKDGVAEFLMKMRNLTTDLEREHAQSEFISTASHEMRTPVAAIQGYIGLALNPKVANIDTKARKCLLSAQAASDRLGELFKNLLDVSRLEDGRLKPQFTQIEVKSFLQKLRDDFEMLARNKKQHFSFELDEVEAFCNLDFTFLQDIVMNLVENAVKYTPEGGNIQMKEVVSDNAVQISVVDNGVGISENDLQHIFQKFYRSENTNLKVGGTGLGLYLAKQRTEMMGGRIDVKSVLGGGSTFTVIFPRVAGNTSGLISGDEFTMEQINPFATGERVAADPLGEDLDKYLKYPKLPQELAMKPFMKMAERWKMGEIPDASEDDRKAIYAQLREYNSYASQEQFDAVWQKFEPRLKNPALAVMMRRFPITSQFIVPWMLSTPSAVSWEFAFGLGYDFAGRWREFPKEDMAYKTALRDPQFCWVRERSILARREVAGKEKVLFLNAGCLPELRNITYYAMPKEVWACTSDVSLNTKDIFGWSTAEHNVHYEMIRMMDYMDKMLTEGIRFDTIIMNGATLTSYDNLENILEEAMKLLKPKGRMLFDVQLMHWDLLRGSEVFGATPGKLSNIPNLEDALGNVGRICERLPNARLEYSIDTGDKPPVGIMFYLEKTQ